MQITKTIAKHATHAGVSAAGLSLLTGYESYFLYNGRKIPVYAIGAGLGVASSVSTDLVSKFLLPHIPGSAKLHHLESLALHLGTSGGVFVIAAKMMNGNVGAEEAKKLFVAGAMAEIVSQYVYSQIVEQELL
jgi:hypothetical protein